MWCTVAVPTCTEASLASGEPLAGSAPVQRGWVLVEHPGPWGRDPLRDAAWPDGIGARLAAAAAACGVKVLAARRHRAQPVGGLLDRPHVVLCWAGPDGWALTRQLATPEELDALPLGELALGRRPDRWQDSGWRDPGQIWGVCTHGLRDACCARLGRPLARAITDDCAAGTWEVSHTGGHRLGAVVISLPEGVFYGRVGADRVPDLLAARRRGEVVTDLLRGRCHLTGPQQAAEAALRRHLGVSGLDGLDPAPRADPDRADPDRTDPDRADPDRASRDGAGSADAGPIRTTWRVGGRLWAVDVHRIELPERPASCGKEPEPAWAWRCDRPRRLA